MTTVEIKEKTHTEMPKIEESVESTDKENIKFIDDENEEITNELKKGTEVIGDSLKKENIFNNVSMDPGYKVLFICCFHTIFIVMESSLIIQWQ